MGRYAQNILQWNKNYIKSTRTTNGDYFNVISSFGLSTDNAQLHTLHQIKWLKPRGKIVQGFLVSNSYCYDKFGDINARQTY